MDGRSSKHEADKKICTKILVLKAEGKRTLGSWEANIKIHIQHRV
jgi:hypothetical protein